MTEWSLAVGMYRQKRYKDKRKVRKQTKTNYLIQSRDCKSLQLHVSIHLHEFKAIIIKFSYDVAHALEFLNYQFQN